MERSVKNLTLIYWRNARRMAFLDILHMFPRLNIPPHLLSCGCGKEANTFPSLTIISVDPDGITLVVPNSALEVDTWKATTYVNCLHL